MIYIAALGAINTLGNNKQQIANNLSENYCAKHFLTKQDGWLLNGHNTWLGKVTDDLPSIPEHLVQYSTRNNQLLYAAYLQIKQPIQQAIEKYGTKRIAVIMGTSTSGIHEGDNNIKYYLKTHHCQPNFHYHQQELGDPSRFLTELLNLKGPSYSISTACTSSAKAVMSGQRLIELGLVDAAIVGGADSLSRMPINGFNALEALSDSPCMPFAKDRNGINIGEASGIILLTKEESSEIVLLGSGESSDAYHISSPHPEGIGAQAAMEMALNDANLTPNEIGYLNLHGTATILNDQAESKAVYRLFNQNLPYCSSTKHLTGHTLGSAAITELAIGYLLLNQNIYLPQQDFSISPYDMNLDKINIVTEKMMLQTPIIMSNSFAFGGNNASLIIGKV
ncbi:MULTISPECIES: beta-ketoacyl-[acyl-carrier-protein] synthase family protein [Gilliamella]|uniref:beta-ketoacyl-[acyl-carrier-protein] synthase family protein n=1 Tax=Gilliamella TaxID=1193503 RepID=UPI00080E1453|nr:MULTISPECIES: beta-ketoacyl-[acyl-carrier-protein] synthase family protein [Gilliamella]MBI0153387.1 beta-ketoacyl-[acyl-carrier-protein] synthase family protein [Gilliamella sp. W8128]MBI0156197.1 beta-ketoacyl-[acyl-carrier-protein] synthase family protein [Gilliamella sp. M0364]MCT6884944.1 beta-ketoacyl-[acyl-carrier-protein] synthase family protein [Gilliamella apis]OCG04554.1 beta-ketoacyl-[acyl-carrier-protein] synthase II [Gilliamella apis]OTQ55352.1 beta-ketoacyl-[acyl-carrier-prot